MTDEQETPPAVKGWLRRGWVQGIIIALLILTVAALALLWSVVPLLNQWLPPLLDRFVAPGSHIKVESLTRQHFDVSELDISPAEGVILRVRDARLSYHGSALLQGRADTLSARSVEIILTSTDNTDGKATGTSTRPDTATDISLPVIRELMDLPVDRIETESFTLSSDAVDLTVAATLTPDLWWLRGNARLPHIPDAVQVEAQLQQADNSRADLIIMLSDRESLLAQFWAGLKQAEGRTAADLRIDGDLAALRKSLPMLDDLRINPDKLTLSGTLESPDEAVWPEQLHADIRAFLGLKRARLADDITLQPSDITAHVINQSDSWQIQASSSKIALSMKLEGDQWQATMPPQSINASCDKSLSDCRLNTRLQGQLTGPTRSEVALSPDLHWQADGTSTLSLPVSLSYQQSETADVPGWTLKSAGQFEASLETSGLWQVSTSGLATDLRIDEYQGWRVSPIVATLFNALTIKGDLNDDRTVDASRISIDLQPLTITSDDAALSFARSSASCDPGTISLATAADALLGNCELALRLRDSKYGLWPVPDAQIRGPVTITYDDLRQRVNAALSLTAADQEIHLRTRLEHDLIANRGSLQWHLTDARLDWQALGLDDMAALTSTQLLSGRLSGQGWVDWQSEADATWTITPDVMLRADGVSAVYDNTITLEEWNAMLALRRPDDGDYLLDAQVSGSKLNSGIPLTNLLARSQTRIPADFSYVDVSVYEMHTDLLGGRVYTPLIRYDSRKEVNAFGIRIDHLQLSQIAAIEEGAGVKATGLLDGMLPIVLTKEGPMVPGGNLFARDPGGVIRYQGDSADALAQSDQSVGMAMNLLQNFQYKQLQSGVQYQPDGQLNLSLQFQGKNPDFFGGQATHLNVNLDYNLLDLLESLRISNEVIEKIEQKYQ